MSGQSSIAIIVASSGRQCSTESRFAQQRPEFILSLSLICFKRGGPHKTLNRRSKLALTNSRLQPLPHCPTGNPWIHGMLLPSLLDVKSFHPRWPPFHSRSMPHPHDRHWLRIEAMLTVLIRKASHIKKHHFYFNLRYSRIYSTWSCKFEMPWAKFQASAPISLWWHVLSSINLLPLLLVCLGLFAPCTSTCIRSRVTRGCISNSGLMSVQAIRRSSNARKIFHCFCTLLHTIRLNHLATSCNECSSWPWWVRV